MKYAWQIYTREKKPPPRHSTNDRQEKRAGEGENEINKKKILERKKKNSSNKNHFYMRVLAYFHAFIEPKLVSHLRHSAWMHTDHCSHCSIQWVIKILIPLEKTKTKSRRQNPIDADDDDGSDGKKGMLLYWFICTGSKLSKHYCQSMANWVRGQVTNCNYNYHE